MPGAPLEPTQSHALLSARAAGQCLVSTVTWARSSVTIDEAWAPFARSGVARVRIVCANPKPGTLTLKHRIGSVHGQSDIVLMLTSASCMDLTLPKEANSDPWDLMYVCVYHVQV